jgi:peptide/nickel transport system substrate-binding protein
VLISGTFTIKEVRMSRRFSKVGWIALTSLLALSLLALPACGQPTEVKNPGVFVQQTIGDLDSLDPAWGYDTASGEQVQYIYETLIFYDGESTGEFVPVLATEWNVSDDDLTYRFKIREGVKFHDGGDLTPSDVEYSFERSMVQDRDGGPIWMFFEPLLNTGGTRDGEGNIVLSFDDIDNAVEVDGQWVQFNLTIPYPPFLQILCGPWASIVDKEWCAANGGWDGTEATWQQYNNPEPGTTELHNQANGTGPWKLERWDPGVQISLVRNDNYWRKPAAFERVVTMVVDEWANRRLALENGDADLVYVPRSYIGELEDVEGLRVYQGLPELTVDAFFFNMAINPESTFVGSGQLDGQGIPLDFFSDIDVRKGFNYAFDWDTYINDAMLGEGEQMGSPVIEGLLYFNSKTPKYSLDLAKAEEHLRAAWDGQVWEKGFKFTIAYNGGNLPRQTACQILADNLRQINPKFDITVQALDWPVLLGNMVTGIMPMFQIGWQADYPDTHNFVYPFMNSNGTFSAWQGYNNPEVDALIEEGIQETDPVAREAIYIELQELYYEDAPGIMLCQPLGRRYFRDWIKGFNFNPIIPGLPGNLYAMSKG